jgi:predicted phage terminase large subunit-like protein
MTVDCAFTDAESSDPVGIHVWGRRGAEAFLLDRHVEVMDFLATCAAVRRMSESWPRALAKWIERKANGHAVIASMSKEIPGLAAWPRKGSQFSQAGKVERVNAVLPAFEAGNVRIPEISAWSAEVEDRWCAFPVGHDEDTDCMTMALIEFYVSDGLEGPTPDEQMEGLRALLEMR